jgi:membrane protein implicated in regulation of membrane protease activity
MAISPIDVFSTLFGAGAVGTLLQHLLTAWPLGLAAAVGGILFDLGFIRPFMGFLLRFASRPSEGLEGEVSSVGEAIIRFDSNGQGVIRINLDEQYRQLLASLDPDERSRGVAVAKGDKVVIVSVDAAKNSCVVSRELAYSGIDASEPSEFSFEKETKI